MTAAVHGPHVMRPSPSASWKVSDRWGPQLADVREYIVRVTGDRFTLSGLKDAGAGLDRETAQALYDAIGQALAWRDD